MMAFVGKCCLGLIEEGKADVGQMRKARSHVAVFGKETKNRQRRAKKMWIADEAGGQ